MRALSGRRDRHGAADCTGSGQVACSGSNIGRTVYSCPAELVRRHAGDAVRDPRVAIDIRHVYIAGDVHRAKAVPVNSGAIPGAESFKRSQRNPADIAESESKTDAKSRSAPSEETN